MMSLVEYLRNARVSHSDIETYIISLIDDSSESVEKDKVISIKNRNIEVDLYCDKGIKALKVNKPLAIEIKIGLLMNVYEKELRKGLEFSDVHPETEYWVVYADTKLHVPSEYGKNIRFYSFAELQEKVGSLKNESTINEESTNRVKGHGKEENDNLEQGMSDQKSIINKAAKSLVGKNCSFILGAGISVDAGSPTWNELLKKLVDTIVQLRPIDRTDYNDINEKCGWSSLITGRYIIGNHLSDSDLIDQMRLGIYTRDQCDYISDKNDTALPYIAKIIDRFHVESTITFNYDEFMEEALEKEGVAFESIIDKGSVKKGIHPVYHVHGLISRDPNEASSYPVLSEKEYHLLYSNNFHWSNIELLHSLTRNTCFLLGLSMSDPNLRRLLEMARYEDGGKARHFIFMRKDPLNSESLHKDKDEKHWKIIETQYAELGLNIIWYDYDKDHHYDFSDLARKLDLIYNEAVALNKI